MTEDCCKGKIKLVQVRSKEPIKLHEPRSAGILNQDTTRAIQIIKKIAEKLHVGEVEGIGHIHGILDDQEKKELLRIRDELVKLLPNVPTKDIEEHIKTLLASNCGSVAAFIANGKIEEHEFDRFYALLDHIDLHFRAGTHEQEKGHLEDLRRKIVESIAKLPESEKDRAETALSNVRAETVEFVLGD